MQGKIHVWEQGRAGTWVDAEIQSLQSNLTDAADLRTGQG